MPTYTIAGKTVVITGAAGGIGAAAARAPQARGANVVLADLGLDAASALAREIGGDRALAVTVDVTDTAALADAVARTVDRFGSLDVLFANAGIAADPPATMATIDEATFERVVQVDLLGVWRTVRAALPHVIAARGHVLVTGSVYAYVNGMANAPYAVSKAGVEQLGRALRTELAIHGATAGVLYLGWVRTPIARFHCPRHRPPRYRPALLDAGGPRVGSRGPPACGDQGWMRRIWPCPAPKPKPWLET